VNGLQVSPTAGVVYMTNLSDNRIIAVDFTGALVLRFGLRPIVDGGPQGLALVDGTSLLIGLHGGYYQKYSPK
jgi:DNA-binding beta-propeller fold protein YncE